MSNLCKLCGRELEINYKYLEQVCACDGNVYRYYFKESNDKEIIRLTNENIFGAYFNHDDNKYDLPNETYYLLIISNKIFIKQFIKIGLYQLIIDITDGCKGMTYPEIVDYAKKLLVFL